jgi:hypothetical protein
VDSWSAIGIITGNDSDFINFKQQKESLEPLSQSLPEKLVVL